MKIKRDTRYKLLKLACFLPALFGLVNVFAFVAPGEITPNFLFDLVFWPLDGAQKFDQPHTKLAICTLGALMLLLSYIVWMLLEHVYYEQPSLVENIIGRGVAGWFVIETVFSLVLGAPLNLALNSIFLVCLVGPIVVPLEEKSPALL